MESKASAVAASLPPYATLLNLKIVIPSPESEYLAVERHLFYDCMRSLLSQVRVDADWYLTRYKDVGEAIARNMVSSAHEHYVRFGYYEHRMPYQIDVDEAWYLNAYSDVREAIAQEHFHSGQDHFETTGFREGRLPFPNFRLATGRTNGPRPVASKSIVAGAN